MAHTLLEHVGAEGFISTADMDAQTAFTNTTSLPVVTESVFGVTGEQWFNLADTPTHEIRYAFTDLPVINGTQREFEFSAAVYFSAITTANTGTSLASAEATDTNSIDIKMGSNPAEPGRNNQLYIGMDISGGTVDGSSSVSDVATGIIVDDGSLLYISIRIRGSSANTVADGKAQVFINGAVFEFDTIAWSGSADTPTLQGAFAAAQVNGVQNCTIYSRNISAHNGFTAADEVPPFYRYIVDTPVTVVTSVDHTNEGSAASITDALNDADNTTYARTDVDGAEITLTLDSPAQTVNKDVLDVLLRTEVTRGGPSFIDYEVALLDGATEVLAEETVLTTVDPNTQRIVTIPVVPADGRISDYTVRLTSGV